MLESIRYELFIGLTFLTTLTQCRVSTSESTAGKIFGVLSSAELALPVNLTSTYMFTDGNPRQPAPELIPYDVKIPLWSDGSSKQRFLFIPPDQKLSYDSATDTFNYPVGTTFVKFFFTEHAPNNPVEARIITLKNDQKWYLGTYVWSASEAGALNDTPRKVAAHDQEYRIPSEKECQLCHTQKAPILGFKLKQLNFYVPAAISGNQKSTHQMDILAEKKIFQSPVEDLKKVLSYESPSDEAISLNMRTRTYFDVNCATCHNPDSKDEKALKLDLRLAAIDTKLMSQKKIIPGNVEESPLWKSISNTKERMPLISLRSDPLLLDLVKKYIEQWPKD